MTTGPARAHAYGLKALNKRSESGFFVFISKPHKLIDAPAGRAVWAHKFLQHREPIRIRAADGRKGQGAEQSHDPILDQANEAFSADVADHLLELLLLLENLGLDLADQALANLWHG